MKARHPLLAFLLRYPKLCLFILLSITGLSIRSAQNLHIEGDLGSLLPPSLESVQSLQKLKQDFGGVGYLYILFEAKDQQSVKTFIHEYIAEINQAGLARYVDYELPTDFFKQRYWLYLDEADLLEIESRVKQSLRLESAGASAFFSDLMDFVEPEEQVKLNLDDIIGKYKARYDIRDESTMSSPSEGFHFIRLKLAQNPEKIDQTRALLHKLRAIENRVRHRIAVTDLQVGYTGTMVKALEQTGLITKEVGRVSTGLIVVLALILYFYFRRWQAVVVIGVPILCALVWTSAFIAVTIGHLNIITSFAAAILAGLASDYGIYLLARFDEARANGVPFEQACFDTFHFTGKATFLSMLTTAVAFASLMLADFKLFFEFGFVGLIGLVLTYLAIIVFLPILLALIGRNPLSRTVVRSDRLSHFQRSLGYRFPKATLIGLVLLVVVSGFTLPQLAHIEFDDGDLETSHLPSYQLSAKIDRYYGASQNPTVFLVAGYEATRQVIDVLINKLEQNPDGLVYNRVWGLSRFIPSHQKQKQSIVARIKASAKGLKGLIGLDRDNFFHSLDVSLKDQITLEELPSALTRQFRSPQDQSDLYAIYLNPAFAREDAEATARYYDGIKQLRKNLPQPIIAVDYTFLTHDIVSRVKSEMPQVVFYLLMFLFVVVWLTVRPLKQGLMVMLFLSLSMILLSGLLWLVSIPLNIINIAMIPIVIGTGLNCFIHFVVRFNEEKNVLATLQAKTAPILLANLTSVVGFGGLVMSSGTALQSAGWLVIVGLLAVTLVCLLAYPAWLRVIGHE